MGTIPTLRPCPPRLQTYVGMWADHHPERRAEAQQVVPYPEDMLPMHEALAQRIEREILAGAPDTPEFAVVREELRLFRESVTAVSVAHEADRRRLDSWPAGKPYEPDRAASAWWSEVTEALDNFVLERRSLAQRAMKKGRELAYFSTAVRTDLDIAPIVAGISVFE